MHSFIHKYNALTKIPIKELFSLFDFVPVVIGRSCIINGAEFRFNYALHSIPSLSFEFTFEDQSFIYSSDHLNDPEKHKELLGKGIITESRYKDLLNFPWHHNIIYHEAGIPPLHTRIEYLQTLPKEIQEKTTVYHISRRDMPQDSHLTLAKFGIENTFYPPITPPKHEEAVQLLDVLASIDIFRDFPIAKAKEFLSIVDKQVYTKGTVLIEKNTPGDNFFIIVSGNVSVEGLDQKDIHSDEKDSEVKQFGSYEYFGEAALITGELRSARIVAKTDVTALTIDKHHFLNFIKGSDLLQKFSLLMKVRKTGTWSTLSNSRFFTGMTSAQKTQLELLMTPCTFPEDYIFIEEGKGFNKAFVIKSGEVGVLKNKRCVEILNNGDLIGEIFQLQKEAPASYGFVARTKVEGYELQRDDLINYINNNPGIYMRLNYVYGG